MPLLGRIRTYAAELAFAARICSDLRSTLLLAVRTVQFHWGNGRSITPRLDSPFEINVRLGRSDVRLTLRPYAGDLFVFYEVHLHQCYALPKHLSDPRGVRTILDCGANIGLTAIYLAEHYPAARVLAIEPHPENFKLLCANTAFQKRITPIQACVAASSGKRKFLTVDKPAWGNRTNETGEGIEVPVATIDSLCRDHDVDFIDILKIDIEGAEKEVFSHSAFLSQVGLVVIELHCGYDLESFHRDVTTRGFAAYAPDPLLGTRMITALRGQHHIGRLAPGVQAFAAR
jgi:FkbM family methyltransferase